MKAFLLTLFFALGVGLLAGCSSMNTGQVISQDEVQAGMELHESQFHACYLAEKTDAKGAITADIIIGRDGRVEDVSVKETTIHLPSLEECILKTIRVIHFSVPNGEGTAEVTYMLRF
jgi:hypothetical protein